MHKPSAFLATAACAAALTFMAPASRTAEAAERLDGIGQLCQRFGALVGFSSQGECASTVASIGPEVCKGDLDNDGTENWAEFNFKNRGECVSTVQRLVREAAKNVP